MAFLQQISFQSLNATFGELAKSCKLVFWMRCLNYKQQLYVSPNYEELFQRTCVSLYQNPAGWMDTLVTEDRDALNLHFKQRANWARQSTQSESLSQESLLFRITKPNGQLGYFRDRAFTVYDSENQPVAMAGMGYSLDAGHWQAEREHSAITTSIDSAEQALILLLQKTLQVSPLKQIIKDNTVKHTNHFNVQIKGCNYQLSFREAQSLLFSLQGNSAKQIATILGISSRTVEIYLHQLKRKIGCRTKLELLSRIDAKALDGYQDKLITVNS